MPASSPASSNMQYQQRLRDRARALWERDGRPTGREAEYMEKAREDLAIECNPHGATATPEQVAAPPPRREDE